MSATPRHDCVGALLVRANQVLLGRRAEDRDWLPGAWDIFGGHLEPGEEAEAALQRELREELGIQPLRWHLLDTLEAPQGDWRLQVFAVDSWRGEPVNRQPREHAELRWLTRADAQARLQHAHPDFGDTVAKAFAYALRPSGR